MTPLLILTGSIILGMSPALVAWRRGIPTGIYREDSPNV